MPVPTFKLNTGVSIPAIGFGTYKCKEGDGQKAILEAVKAGYRSFDTATIYGNEEEVGSALKQSGLPRSEFFITTKVWMTRSHDPEASLDESLKRLGTDYVDLFLIHWPITQFPDGKLDPNMSYIDFWKAMEAIPKTKARAIGVSNFTVNKLKKLLETAKVVPAVDQCELHPRLQQQKLVDFCHEHGILPEAFAPLGHGKLAQTGVDEVAKKHGVDMGQIAISWNVQRGVGVIPKTSTPSRMKTNQELVHLDSDDLEKIKELAKNPMRTCPPNPSWEGGEDVFENDVDVK